MARVLPWRRKPSDELTTMIEEAATRARFFLVQEAGPTSFVLSEGDSGRKVKVFIGNTHCCSCTPTAPAGFLCVHILFVMIRVFKLPKDSPLVYQQALVDSEIAELLVLERLCSA